ncbi:MAG: ATP-binding protein [Candidatus Aminicenantes bacterium]|nr:ATP-binding protein [Candidatus Aminicenantes bacterium]
MIKKAKRYFNTSGPNLPQEHYTLKREKLIEKGIDLVKKRRYFTIWAPRQTGKSTYFNMLTQGLKTLGYEVVQVNVENYKEAPMSAFFNYLYREIAENWKITLNSTNFGDLQNDIAVIKDKKFVLVIDEIEGLNPAYFGQFLHTIRSLYQDRESHSLKSVILVGVSNILGVVQDNAGTFNIADNLEVPYFTDEETFDLLHMHEVETGQLFHRSVKEKICAVTANQPGLVNGFAYQLVERFPQKEIIDYDDYLAVEDWYLTEAIDKNISNIINKAKQHRTFLEKLLFTGAKVKYQVNDEKIKFLHAHGLIKKDKEGYVEFWVPMYKKAVYEAFYPYTNGESGEFLRHIDLRTLVGLGEDGKSRRLNLDLIIGHYKNYVKRRSFKYFREKDGETGRYKSIKEAALAYSFETYIQALVQVFEGKSYLEPHSGLGRCDLIINIDNNEYVIEFKIFRDIFQFEKGKTQLAYYAKSLGLNEALYLVFVPNTVTLEDVRDQKDTIDGVVIGTYIVLYDEEKDF